MRRLAALVFALLLTAAPVVASLCQATCAVHDAVAAAPMHECHQVAAPEGPAVQAGPHACGHGAIVPDAVSPALLILDTPALLPVAIDPVDLTGVRLLPATEPAHSPPGLVVARSSQIRI